MHACEIIFFFYYYYKRIYDKQNRKIKVMIYEYDSKMLLMVGNFLYFFSVFILLKIKLFVLKLKNIIMEKKKLLASVIRCSISYLVKDDFIIFFS